MCIENTHASDPHSFFRTRDRPPALLQRVPSTHCPSLAFAWVIFLCVVVLLSCQVQHRWRSGDAALALLLTSRRLPCPAAGGTGRVVRCRQALRACAAGRGVSSRGGHPTRAAACACGHRTRPQPQATHDPAATQVRLLLLLLLLLLSLLSCCCCCCCILLLLLTVLLFLVTIRSTFSYGSDVTPLLGCRSYLRAPPCTKMHSLLE